MSAFGGKADIAVKLLTRDDARRIAVNIAKLPELSLNNRPTELRAGGPLLLMVARSTFVLWYRSSCKDYWFFPAPRDVFTRAAFRA